MYGAYPLDEDFGALVLDVVFGSEEEGADGAEGDDPSREPRAGLSQILDPKMVSRVHQP